MVPFRDGARFLVPHRSLTIPAETCNLCRPHANKNRNKNLFDARGTLRPAGRCCVGSSLFLGATGCAAPLDSPKDDGGAAALRDTLPPLTAGTDPQFSVLAQYWLSIGSGVGMPGTAARDQSLAAIMEFFAHEIPNLPAMNAGALTEIALGVACTWPSSFYSG